MADAASPRVFDFGGQEVFCLLHPLFLIPYTVCMVCFNLTDFLRDDTNIKALDDLKFWFGSIVVHPAPTVSSDGKICLPPIVLVGTHADAAGLPPVSLIAISNAIFQRLSRAVFDLVKQALIKRPDDEFE